MRRKYGRLLKKENVVVFPGTYERIVEEGLTAVEQSLFEEAVVAFDQAINLDPDDTDFLGPYAVSLYETKEFERAKEMAAKLLHSGTTDYIDAMELYLTISIQLQEYEEVELTIDTLFDEGIVPQELLGKFNYIRELNDRLANRYGIDENVNTSPVFTLEEFKGMSPGHQQMTLASLEGTDITPIIPVVKQLAELDEVSPICKSFALTLLQQIDLTEEVTVKKFGMEAVCIPSDLILPGEDDFTKNVQKIIRKELSKDPTRLEMALGLIGKFVITAYPFNWGPDYQELEVANAYIDYIECLFTGQRLPDNKLHLLIQEIDVDPDF